MNNAEISLSTVLEENTRLRAALKELINSLGYQNTNDLKSFSIDTVGCGCCSGSYSFDEALEEFAKLGKNDFSYELDTYRVAFKVLNDEAL